ncbi:MAG: prephenate dehydrogenase/arogenate dehydrogenase family protein [Nitrososphaerota archaeon]
MRFTIIGCGRMGSWFAESLADRRADLLLLDQDRKRAVEVAERVGGRVINSLNEVTQDSPIVLALPIGAMAEVLDRLSKSKKRRLRIVEISSFKKPIWRKVIYARKRGHVVASIHPLFGPGQKDDRDTITIHVGRASRAEDMVVRRLLPRTTIYRMTWPEHDKAMLAALSFTHFIGISSAHLLSRMTPVKVMTKSLEALLALISISLLEPIEFYTGYPMANREAIKLFKKYSDFVAEFVDTLERGRAVQHINKAKRILSARYDLERIYRHFYATPTRIFDY